MPKLQKICYKGFKVAEALNRGSTIIFYKDLPKEVLKLPYLISDLRIFANEWELPPLSFKVLDNELFLFINGKSAATFRKPLLVDHDGYLLINVKQHYNKRFWLFKANLSDSYKDLSAL